MKVTRTTTDEVATPDMDVNITFDGDGVVTGVDVTRKREHATDYRNRSVDLSSDFEMLERVAAILALRRAAMGDKRVACIDHGYQLQVLHQGLDGDGVALGFNCNGLVLICEVCEREHRARETIDSLKGNEEAP